VKVYQRALGAQLPNAVNTPETLGAAKRFPLGIAREDAEDVVRDPLFFTPDGKGLACLSAAPENCVLHILTVEPNDLYQAVDQATADLRAANTQAAEYCLVFDCFSRCTLLSDEFSQELTQLHAQLSPLAGNIAPQSALALGEIESDRNRLPEFYNKTTAVAVLHG